MKKTRRYIAVMVAVLMLAAMFPATVSATQYNLGAFTYNHNWAPGWNTDGRNDGSYALQMETLQAAEYLVLEFTEVPENNIEVVMMSAGNNWAWTQQQVFNPENTPVTTARIRLAGVPGWSTFVSEGPGYFGLGGIGSDLASAHLVLAGGGGGGGNLVLTIGSTTATVGGTNHTLDAAPFIQGGRTMVPMAFIGEQLGATISWNNATRTATFVQGTNRLNVTIGQRLYNAAGQYMGTPVIQGGRTFVPVGFVADAMGATVQWNAAARTVTIPV